MHLFFGHVSINNTYAVMTFILMMKRIITLGILGIYIRTSPMSVSMRIMPPSIQMKRMSFSTKRELSRVNMMMTWMMVMIRATGMGSVLGQLGEWKWF